MCIILKLILCVVGVRDSSLLRMVLVMFLFVLCVTLTISGVSSEGCTGFHYHGLDGQESWGRHFNQCAGKHQSPMDIDSVFVKMVALSPLQMDGFNSTLNKAFLTNNGHTDKVYEFAQLHFHWGANDLIGSKDKIDGKSFPLELHMVFYNKEYSDVNSAMNHSDGLCVLIAAIHKAPTLFDLLLNDLSHYFTYDGSLTTPPCAEVITWIDFKEPIKIKANQVLRNHQIHKFKRESLALKLAAFRRLLTDEGHQLINNFRVVKTNA